MFWSFLSSILGQAGDTSAVLSPIVAAALIGLLIAKELMSGIANVRVRRVNRYLTFFTVPLFIFFISSVLTVIIARVFANIS